MPVPPEAVWDVLADPGEYGYWVVGSKVIRDADPRWPEPGSRFHHTIGFGPFTLDDHTVALETERPDGIYRPAAFLPPLQLASLGRNAESLMRLEELALRKAPSSA